MRMLSVEVKEPNPSMSTEASDASKVTLSNNGNDKEFTNSKEEWAVFCCDVITRQNLRKFFIRDQLRNASNYEYGLEGKPKSEFCTAKPAMQVQESER